jgi:hypothetical protein
MALHGTAPDRGGAFTSGGHPNSWRGPGTWPQTRTRRGRTAQVTGSGAGNRPKESVAGPLDVTTSLREKR